MSGRLYSPAAHIISPRFEVVDGSARILLDLEGLSWLVLDDAETARDLAHAALSAAEVLDDQERAGRVAELGEARRPRYLPGDELMPTCPECGVSGSNALHYPGCPLTPPGQDQEKAWLVHGTRWRPAGYVPAHAGDGTPGPAEGNPMRGVAPGEAGQVREDAGPGIQHEPFCFDPDCPGFVTLDTPGPAEAAPAGAGEPSNLGPAGPGARVEFAGPRACDCPVRDGNTYHQQATCTDPVAARLGWYAGDPQDPPGPDRAGGPSSGTTFAPVTTAPCTGDGQETPKGDSAGPGDAGPGSEPSGVTGPAPHAAPALDVIERAYAPLTPYELDQIEGGWPTDEDPLEPAPQPAAPWEPAEGDQITQWSARSRPDAEAEPEACVYCEAPLNRDGSCSRSCIGVGDG